MTWLRGRIDAWYLARAVRVFERRGWLMDPPGRFPSVGTTIVHLRYRARALRLEPRTYR